MPSVSALKERSPDWVRELARQSTRAYGMATARWRGKPDYLIIGAKRGGTTSMYNYLRMHPGVLGMFPQPRASKSSDYFFGGAVKGSRWYTSHFHTTRFLARTADKLGYAPVTGEASPYYIWDPRIAALAYQANPDVRAIMLIRDPVERAFSHWQERVQNGVEPLDFAAALAAEPARTSGELERMLREPGYHSTAHDWYTYRARGIYQPQLENWLGFSCRAVARPSQRGHVRRRAGHSRPRGEIPRVAGVRASDDEDLQRQSSPRDARRTDPGTRILLRLAQRRVGALLGDGARLDPSLR